MNLLPDIDSIIFDLDGTLWDTCRACAIGWNNVLRRHAIPFREIAADDVRGVAGKPHEACIRTVFRELGEEHLQVLIHETMEEDNRIVSELGGELYEGVLAGLGKLSARLPLFIVSNCQAGYIETFLEWSKLSPLFKDFECWGNTGKPKSDNIRAVIDRSGLRRPIYVGDTEGDHKAARDCRIPFIYMSYGFGACEAPDLSFESFGQFVDASR